MKVKHIAPVSEETHHEALCFKLSCKAKNWDETIKKLLQIAKQGNQGDGTSKEDPNPSSQRGEK